ncbi:MAG TPA: hypothetical protein DD490_10905 [Acidobacteria bacterium]|nr:hypothetical protein [Acidobacteriota bacterium]
MTLRHWYGGLLGGLLPILLLGFLSSALADRLLFVYWALGLGTVWVLLLRHGFAAGWPGTRLAGALGLLGAAGLAAFAALEARHHEILDLGFRAVLPGLYHPIATRPATAAAVAALLAVAGTVALLWRRTSA